MVLDVYRVSVVVVVVVVVALCVRLLTAVICVFRIGCVSRCMYRRLNPEKVRGKENKINAVHRSTDASFC